MVMQVIWVHRVVPWEVQQSIKTFLTLGQQVIRPVIYLVGNMTTQVSALSATVSLSVAVIYLYRTSTLATPYLSYGEYKIGLDNIRIYVAC